MVQSGNNNNNSWMKGPPKTRAEQILEARAHLAPEISPFAAKAVSAQRKELLEDEVNAGLFREQGSGYNTSARIRNNSSFYNNELTPAGVVVVGGSKNNLLKVGQTTNAGPSGAGGPAGIAFRGSGGTVNQIPDMYSPFWLNSNLSLPRDRATINAWCRSFFALNPIVQNAISLHSTYPIAKLNIKCKDRRIEQFFADMIEEINLMNICVQIAQEFWCLGEAFVYAELDERTAKWSRLSIYNPDYIHVKRSISSSEPIISLRPDENLRRIVTSNRPADKLQRAQLDPAIIEHVRKGENIPLHNFYVSHLARKISPYEIRGTGLIVNCFRSLMLWDKFREAKYIQASNMVNPLTLVKIGNQEFKPTPTDLEAWRSVFERATGDPDAKIFTHEAVTVERVGYGQGIYDIGPDVTQLIKEIYIGLMVPSVLMDGTDTTYANGSVALDVLRQRYMAFRNMLASWLKYKIFAPISQLNEFYEVVDGEKRLIVPEIDWNHMSLFDMTDYIQNLTALAQGDGPAKKVSLQTLYRSLGLEYEDEIRKIRYEDIADQIRQKEMASLSRYTLNELRALSPDDEIKEIAEPPLPGESPYDDAGMAGGEAGLPGVGGPGLPGLPPPPGAPPSAPIGAGGPHRPRIMPQSPGPKPPPTPA